MVMETTTSMHREEWHLTFLLSTLLPLPAGSRRRMNVVDCARSPTLRFSVVGWFHLTPCSKGYGPAS
jgi:hypothetical protein